MDVSIPQGDPPPQSDGNVMPIDLTQNRIFMRLAGTQSATVSADGGNSSVHTLCAAVLKFRIACHQAGRVALHIRTPSDGVLCFM